MSNSKDETVLPTDDTEKKEVPQAPLSDDEKLQQAEVPTRKVKMFMVNPADFMFLFTKGMTFRKHTKLVQGLPEDAQLVAVVADTMRNGIMMVIQSESYKPIKATEFPPTEYIQIQTGVVGATKKKATKRKK